MNDNRPQWSATEYAKNLDHHRRLDGDFLADINPAPDSNILDVGCGVGDFTEKLCDLVPQGRVVGVDSSPEMIAEASARKRENLLFRLASAEKLSDVDLGGPFDLIVSRACLHWIPLSAHPAVLAGMAAQLCPGGRIRVEFGGAGNIHRTIRQMLEVAARKPYVNELPNPFVPWDFLTPGQYLDLLIDSPFDECGARVWSVAQLRSMGEGDEGLRGWFNSQVALSVSSLLPERLRSSYEEEVFQRILPLCRRPDGTTAEIYVRLNIDARLRIE